MLRFLWDLLRAALSNTYDDWRELVDLCEYLDLTTGIDEPEVQAQLFRRKGVANDS
jgi:hypothetical protein